MNMDDRHCEIEEHIAACPKCRHASRMGHLCPVGRKWLKAELNSLIRPAELQKPQGMVVSGVK